MYWDGCLPEFSDLLSLPSEKSLYLSRFLLPTSSPSCSQHIGFVNFLALLHLFKLANPTEIINGAFSCFILCVIFITSYCSVY